MCVSSERRIEFHFLGVTFPSHQVLRIIHTMLLQRRPHGLSDMASRIGSDDFVGVVTPALPGNSMKETCNDGITVADRFLCIQVVV